jgi:hypothetical protein
MLGRYLAVIILAMLGTHAARADRVMVPAAGFGMGCSAGDPACEADEGKASCLQAGAQWLLHGCDLAGRQPSCQCTGPARYAWERRRMDLRLVCI